MNTDAALLAFEALSQETRLSALRLLVQAGPQGLAAGEISDRLDTRQNTMSTHLKVLSAAGLIDSHRDGRSIIYSTNYDTIRQLVLFLMDDCCKGSARVCGPVAKSLASRA